jgi:hypothetical protein
MAGSFTGIPFGATQTSFFDQQGTALPGHIYSASDDNLTDAEKVSDPNGVECGCFVLKTPSLDIRPGINEQGVAGVAIGTTTAQIAGIVVRTQMVQTDAAGRNYVDYRRMATIMRRIRAGGRIWAKNLTACNFDDPVYVNLDPANGSIGAVGNAAGTNWLLMPNAFFKSTQIAGDGIGLVELGS